MTLDCKSGTSILLPPELTNMVAVVDTVAKDVDLQQRLTSSANQLVRTIEMSSENQDNILKMKTDLTKILKQQI